MYINVPTYIQTDIIKLSSLIESVACFKHHKFYIFKCVCLCQHSPTYTTQTHTLTLAHTWLTKCRYTYYMYYNYLLFPARSVYLLYDYEIEKKTLVFCRENSDMVL